MDAARRSAGVFTSVFTTKAEEDELGVRSLGAPDQQFRGVFVHRR